jgi:hypothetical protein
MLESPRCWSMSKGRKASERPELRAFRIEAPTPFGYRVAGRLVMGISRAKYLQLVEQYPPNPLTRAADRRVDEAIQALIGQPEMAKLISYLDLPEDADVRLEPSLRGALWVDYLKRKRAFADTEDGTEFWVDPQ